MSNANYQVIESANGYKIAVSYKTVIGIQDPDGTVVTTCQWYSSTTTKHINKFLESVGYKYRTSGMIPQDEINDMAQKSGLDLEDYIGRYL
jgi:hypothetical protein